MKSGFTYQQLFQSLKGVQAPILNSLVLPIEKNEYALEPINCNEHNISQDIIKLLTDARNANQNSFLTVFNSTTTRTKSWLTNIVAFDEGRILFVLKNTVTDNYYGYMGFAYGSIDGSYIEADAIVRTSKNVIPGLMKKAFQKMINWIKLEVGLSQVWIRVLSDNPAIEFYKKCDFEIQEVKPLYNIISSDGRLIELSVESPDNKHTLSKRTLTYMKLK